ncbi:uncharacterized protein LOC122304517 [Carya illinoinensis]|uniref:uncharacterized protein LOC122304517 n=1 Tax=Carya illinoinensis TaxID=32201 RepID=UPI001C721CEA|nr:uncharacterized protein LOC122304517 [Carya illinoinensis]
MCVSSVSYSVLVNGTAGKWLTPSRGLRQGDPISPYLFILCAEGLSSLLNGAEAIGSLKGVAVARGGVRVNHLLFADDCLIFGRAKLTEWKCIQGLLKEYEEASGQCLNLEKTTMFFSSNTSITTRLIIKNEAGVSICGNYEKYLGLPAMVGRSKFNTFRVLKERVWAKIHNWKNSFLSQAGKEILLKAVAQAIPTFAMSVFRLPKRLCADINSLLAKF